MGTGRLEGQVAIITGGASGIGRSAVQLFVSEGARVVIGDVQDAPAAQLADELGDACLFRHADVSNEDHVAALVETAERQFGRLDCLFNNAGLAGPTGSIEDVREADLDFALGVLLKSVVFGAKHATRVLERDGGGCILNTASLAGIRAGDAPHIYSAAKAAVVHLTRSLALELGERGIRVNCICPGPISTPLLRGAFQGDASLDEFHETLANLAPIGRVGMPADVAQAALYLASDAASFVTGHILVVDGGLGLGRKWSRHSDASGGNTR